MRSIHAKLTSTISTSRFIGREAELEALALALPAAEGGSGRFVAITGDPGMGKTRLMEELADVAVRTGNSVLWSQMAEDPGAPPYFSWKLALRSCLHQFEDDNILAGLGRAVTDIADIVPELRGGRGNPSGKLRNEDPARRYQLFDSVTRLLLNASKKRPIVILFDNLHAIDQSSIALIEYFCRQIHGHPILVVAAYRDAEVDRGHPLRSTVRNLSRGSGFLNLSLDGLTRDETAELLHLHIAYPPPPALVEAVHRQSGGNPLFVTEVGQMLSRKVDGTQISAAGVHFDVPASLRDVIGARLDALPKQTYKVLRVAAVLGQEFEIQDLAKLNEMRVERTGQAIAPAEKAGIIESIGPGRARFQHVLFREVLYTEQSTITRVVLHRKAAEQLEERFARDLTPHIVELAHHYFQAAQAGKVEKAITYCRRASEAAAAQRAYAEAVIMLDCALQVSELDDVDHAQRRFELLLAMGRLQYAAGHLTASVQSLIKASILAFREKWWERLADALFSFQMICQQSGYRHVSSIPLHNAVLESVDKENVPVRARTLVSLAKAYRTSGKPGQARDAFRKGVELARQSGDANLLLDCLRKGSWTVGREPDALEEGLSISSEALSLAKACGSPDGMLDAVVDTVFQLCDLGDISGVNKQLGELRQLAKEERQPHFENILVGFEAALAILEGRWADATRYAQVGVRQVPLQGVMGLQGRFSFQMFAINKAQGLLGQVRMLAGQIMAASKDEQLWQPGQVLLLCELGQVQDARNAIERIGDLRQLPQDDMRAIAMAYLAESCVRLNDAPRCLTLYEMMYPYRQRNITLPGTLMLGSADLNLAMLANVIGRIDEAVEHFETALRMNASMGAIPALAESRASFARFLVQHKVARSGARARKMMVEARADAEKLSLRPVIQMMGEASGVNPDIDSLTSREVDVLRTLASGASNDRIADSLNISHNTVATHIGHILKKLGVRNRTEAADLARRAGLLE